MTKAVATKAPAKAVDNKAKPMAASRVSSFVRAYKSDNKSVVIKSRAIGESIKSGSTVGKIAEQLRATLIAEKVHTPEDFPKSFSASITHYNTAHVAASTLLMAGNDDVLYHMYRISTGAVKASQREALVTDALTNKLSPEQVVSAVRQLLAKGKAPKVTPEQVAANETAEDIDPTPETISPMDDVRKLTKQLDALLSAILDSAESSDEPDYSEYAEAVALVSDMADRHALSDEA